MEPFKTGAVAPEAAKRVVGKLPKERIPVVKKEEVRVILQPQYFSVQNAQVTRGVSFTLGGQLACPSQLKWGEVEKVMFENLSRQFRDRGQIRHPDALDNPHSISIWAFLPAQKNCFRNANAIKMFFQGPKKAPTSTANSSSSNCTETASTSATSSCYGETDSGVDFEDISEKISEGGDSVEEDGDGGDGSEDEDDGTDKNKNGGKKGLNDGDSVINEEDSRQMLEDDSDGNPADSDVETDSDDFTDSEDDTVEFMPDGEQVRKCKRGFKVLQNCKRFWKVDNNV